MMRGIISALSSQISNGIFLRPNFFTTRTVSSRIGFPNQHMVKFNSFAPAIASNTTISFPHFTGFQKPTLLKPQQVFSDQIRTVIKFSLSKGKRKSVRAVTDRFFRLPWGIWIRTIAGRHKKLWLKPAKRRRRLYQHVFCNKTQSKMLDKMVNKFWRKPKYYIEDPYAPYLKRESFGLTSRKPWRPEGVDYE